MFDTVRPSDHVKDQGGRPVKAAWIVGEAPRARRALPTLYVVVDGGETIRVYGLEVMFDAVNPSDHVNVHGAVPVRLAWICADPPWEMVPPPLTLAVGAVQFTVTVAEPPLVPEQ